MTTMQDLITQQTTDAAQVAADGEAITADQQKLADDTGKQSADQSTQASDATLLDTALQTTGPVATVSVDQLSVTIFAAAGAVVPVGSPIPLASSVQIPAATPPAVPSS